MLFKKFSSFLSFAFYLNTRPQFPHVEIENDRKCLNCLHEDQMSNFDNFVSMVKRHKAITYLGNVYNDALHLQLMHTIA